MEANKIREYLEKNPTTPPIREDLLAQLADYRQRIDETFDTEITVLHCNDHDAVNFTCTYTFNGNAYIRKPR